MLSPHVCVSNIVRVAILSVRVDPTLVRVNTWFETQAHQHLEEIVMLQARTPRNHSSGM